jgi:hypothetical protein
VQRGAKVLAGDKLPFIAPYLPNGARLALFLRRCSVIDMRQRLCPSVLEAAVVVKPETLVRWHRSGLRLYRRWKSRRRVGRPAVPADIPDLIRTISRDNPLWGAPRIHGELLKLGIDIAQSTVAKYMSPRHGPRSPGWQTFLRNHTAHIAGIDLRARLWSMRPSLSVARIPVVSFEPLELRHHHAARRDQYIPVCGRVGAQPEPITETRARDFLLASVL